MRKPIVGEKLWVINLTRCYSLSQPSSGKYYKVTSVGRKYFKVCPEETGYEITFHIKDWEQKTDFICMHKIYETKQIWENAVEKGKYLDLFHKEFSHSIRKFTLQQLKEAAKILNLSLGE